MRRAKKRALIAVGHKILIATYFILRDKIVYEDLGYEYLSHLNSDRKIKNYLKKLKEIGVELEVKSMQPKGRLSLEVETSLKSLEKPRCQRDGSGNCI